MGYWFLFVAFGLTVMASLNAENAALSEELPESETTGACQKQSDSMPNKRNCRYGLCEQIKNGTDYTCHCDKVVLNLFLTWLKFSVLVEFKLIASIFIV